MRRRDFIATAVGGVTGALIPRLATAQSRPCPPPSLSVDGGSTTVTSCGFSAAEDWARRATGAFYANNFDFSSNAELLASAEAYDAGTTKEPPSLAAPLGLSGRAMRYEIRKQAFKPTAYKFLLDQGRPKTRFYIQYAVYVPRYLIAHRFGFYATVESPPAWQPKETLTAGGLGSHRRPTTPYGISFRPVASQTYPAVTGAAEPNWRYPSPGEPVKTGDWTVTDGDVVWEPVMINGGFKMFEVWEYGQPAFDAGEIVGNLSGSDFPMFPSMSRVPSSAVGKLSGVSGTLTAVKLDWSKATGQSADLLQTQPGRHGPPLSAGGQTDMSDNALFTRRRGPNSMRAKNHASQGITREYRFSDTQGSLLTQGHPDPLASENGAVLVPDAWNVFEFYLDREEGPDNRYGIAKMWHAAYGQAPKLVSATWALAILTTGAVPLSPGLVANRDYGMPWTGVALLLRPENMMADYGRADTFGMFGEVIASDKPIAYPGGYALPSPGRERPASYSEALAAGALER